MILLLILIIVFFIYQLYALHSFCTKCISLHSSEVTGDFVFLSDLHGHTYGDVTKGKSRLYHKIQKLQPQSIVIGGDAVSKNHPEQYERIAVFATYLQEIAPVYYLFGNHETSLSSNDATAFDAFLRDLKSAGIQVVRNDAFFPCNEQKISAFALELPLEFYKKRQVVSMPSEYLDEALSSWDKKAFNLLFVHQPAFGDAYAKLSVDGIFSGHTHGGLVRIPGVGSLISTELTWWPKYDGGLYYIGENRVPMVVSQGLGTHHFHIRVFDPAQLIYVTINSCKEEQNSVK